MDKEKSKSDYFDESILKFLTNIESLWTSFPTVLKTIETSQTNAALNHNKYLKEQCQQTAQEGHYIVAPEQRRKNDILRKATTNSAVANKIIKRNFLASLVSQFDTYISDLIRSIFLVRPEILNNSEKKINFSDLLEFPNIEAAKEYILEKEIETVLRESHTEQFKWFEKKLGIELRKDLPSWKIFIEMTQRRNVYIHNDGKVSSQYLSVCKDNKVVLPTDLQIGAELDINSQYFENAFKVLFEIGVKLNQVLRRNLLPDEIEKADISFLNISFELIMNHQYELAKELYDFSDKFIKKISTENLRLRILLNRAQTYKWLNQENECAKILKTVDWSAKDDLFKMANFILREDYKNAIKCMKKIQNAPDLIGKSEYKDWPIFKKFRETPEFKETYLEIFNEAFEITEEAKQ